LALLCIAIALAGETVNLADYDFYVGCPDNLHAADDGGSQPTGLSTAATVGIVVGAVAAVALLGIVICRWRRDAAGAMDTETITLINS